MGLPDAASTSILNAFFPEQAAVVNGQPQYVTNLPQIRKTLEAVMMWHAGYFCHA
jgi:hypothetical protein